MGWEAAIQHESAESTEENHGQGPDGRLGETVRVTEAMATALLQVYEDRRIRHPRDEQLRDDLRKPEKVTSAGGRVSIAATRNEAGHADHFWSLALALEAARNAPSPGPGIEVFEQTKHDSGLFGCYGKPGRGVWM
jgi:phage FluMu gp28-like protein